MSAYFAIPNGNQSARWTRQTYTRPSSPQWISYVSFLYLIKVVWSMNRYKSWPQTRYKVSISLQTRLETSPVWPIYLETSISTTIHVSFPRFVRRNDQRLRPSAWCGPEWSPWFQWPRRAKTRADPSVEMVHREIPGINKPPKKRESRTLCGCVFSSVLFFKCCWIVSSCNRSSIGYGIVICPGCFRQKFGVFVCYKHSPLTCGSLMPFRISIVMNVL